MTCACTPTPRPARRSTSTRCSTACPSATTSTSAAPGPCSTRCSGAPGRAGGGGGEPAGVHGEFFAAPAAAEGDQPFEVELARSGQRFTVPAGQSILDCLIENGCDP